MFGWAVVASCCGNADAGGEDDAVRFSRDVLPILADHCFSCHGPDESHRKADLRLDTREGALAAISLQDPASSELLQRVMSTDPEIVMPPPSANRRSLTSQQTDVLRHWLAQGAPWGRHWSFEPPVKAPLPGDQTHPVDAFVLSALQQRGMEFSPPAPLHTLARRAALDITGLPPSPVHVDRLRAQRSDQGVDPASWDAFVDDLLQSPHYGERMAMWWLDAARYADTDGFQGDATRTNWPWRDWVVQAFNSNMPFDQFTVQQFAGDLLPEATAEQKLATAFHRNHMTNGEGGRDPEESRIDYVIDRVNSVGTVWLGLTLGCCQCHSHKYDPVSHRDYYSLNAFFNSIDEDGKAGRGARPYLPWESTSVARALAEAQELLDERRKQESQAREASAGPFTQWVEQQAERLARTSSNGVYQAWSPLTNVTLESTEGTELQQAADGTIQASGPNPNQDDYRVVARVPQSRVTGIRLQVLPSAAHTRGRYSRGRDGHFILTDIKVQVRQQGSSQVRDIAVSGAVADAADDPGKHQGYGDIRHVLDDDPRNGWSTRDSDPGQTRTAVFALAQPLSLADDEELVFELRHRSTLGDASIGRFIVSVTDEAGPAVTSLEKTPLEQLTAAGVRTASELPKDLKERLQAEFLADYTPYQLARSAQERAQTQFDEVRESRKVDVMVLAERSEPRDTHVLLRGVWDKKGEIVTPDVPAAIAPWPEQQPRTRLGLAQWIVSRDNPLTARVVVNHVWQLLFGAGLVRTTDDFGVQGERPSHPQLLDWLAVDLMENNWNLKRLIRLIVTSRTYQQRSDMTPQQLAVDPENRWLGRGARFRLPSWMLRDAALSASGLINPALGGPPVRPWQPDGVWEEMFMGRFRYVPSDGPAQYRRSLYAFWRRAVAPTFLFDSAQRRVCEVRPVRTNTPLQALTLLNDGSYLEAARALAEQAIRMDDDPDGQLRFVTERVLLRPPAEAEYEILAREYRQALDWYAGHPREALQFLDTTDRNGQIAGRYPIADPDDPQNHHERQAHLASLVVVAGIVLNLDEAITHE